MTDEIAVTTPSKKAGIALFQSQIEEKKGWLAQMLPAQIPVDKFIRTTMTAVLVDPTLLNADRQSLMIACMRAAQDGLLCDKREAALVIFNTKDGDQWIKKVQYMPMAYGLLKKMRNTGELASITAHVAYEKDKFSYVMGDNESITHEPYLDGEPGDVKFAYAIAKLKDGTIQREVMTRAQIDKVRAVSKAKDSGPWVGWYDEMARKSVLRRLSKYLPSSPEVDGVIRSDDETYEMVDVTPEAEEPKKLGSSAVKEKLKKKVKHDPETGEIMGDASTREDEEGLKQPSIASPAPEPELKLLTTDQVKQAASVLIIALEAAPPVVRSELFVKMHGNAIVDALRTHGQGIHIGKIKALGIALPESEEA